MGLGVIIAIAVVAGAIIGGAIYYFSGSSSCTPAEFLIAYFDYQKGKLSDSVKINSDTKFTFTKDWTFGTQHYLKGAQMDKIKVVKGSNGDIQYSVTMIDINGKVRLNVILAPTNLVTLTKAQRDDTPACIRYWGEKLLDW